MSAIRTTPALVSDGAITYAATDNLNLDQRVLIETTLKASALFGSTEQIKFINDDRQRAMSIATNHKVANHHELLARVQERIDHGALGNGVL